MHTHFGSAVNGLATFLAVAIIGTFWRLSALHMVASRIRILKGLGRAMLFQY